MGVGIINGRLVVHTEEKSEVAIQEITKQVSVHIMDSNSRQLINGLQVKNIVITAETGTVHGGDCISVKDEQGRHIFATLGSFVKATDENMYALTSEHMFENNASFEVELAEKDQNETQYSPFGKLDPQFKIKQDYKVDIAAIKVNKAKINQCITSLKSLDGSDNWKNVMYEEDDFNNLIDRQVYKRGSTSALTRGRVSCIDYRRTNADCNYNMIIQSEAGSTQTFSSIGDSGSIICMEDPIKENVMALSILCAGMVEKNENNHQTLSCHLKKNLTELSRQSGQTFQLYD